MNKPFKAQCLRVYIDEHACIGSLPIYEAIILHLKKLGFPGATVFRGILSFGHLSPAEGKNLHGNWLSNDLPVLIECIGEQEKIIEAIPHITELMGNRGLIACVELDIFHQRNNSQA